MGEEYIKNIRFFFKSSSFQKGLVLTVAILIPIIILNVIGFQKLSFSVAIGALLNAPSDVPGSLRRKVNSILTSIVLTMLVTLITIYARPFFWLLLVVLAVLSFGVSLISVYGSRGALISFSGLLAIVLGLANHEFSGTDIWIHVGLIGLGGLWYLLVSLLFYRMSPKKDEDELLKDTLSLTGDYLKLRADLLMKNTKRENLQKEALKLQTQISGKHEILRELLLITRKRTGRSHFDEKRLLIFISLVDILELALANTWDYKKIDQLFENQQDSLKPFQELNLVIGNHLKIVADLIITKSKLPLKNVLLEALSKANKAIDDFVVKVKLPEARDGAIMLRNLYDYQEKQVYEVRSIRRVLANVKNASSLSIKRQEADQFITHQEYSFSIILENLSFRSPIFRHALRLTIAILFSYVLGFLIGIKNPYWIVLTLIVIMRPNYGLTKQRSLNRVAGTIAGAAIASVIILLTQNVIIYAVLAVFSLTFAFALVQQSYKIAATFVTIHIVFLYALIEPNAFEIIKFRVLDTFIGAAIALAANYVLWPSWEFMNLQKVLQEVIQKNKNYLQATQNLYHTKKITQLGYKIPRKEAFLAISNLNAAFERMTQDPKSKQKEYELIYELVTLNNTILSAIASLGSFIQNHHTTEAFAQFDIIIRHIDSLFTIASTNLDKANEPVEISDFHVTEAEEKLLDSYESLSEKREKEIQEGIITIQQEMLLHLQEAHLLYNQLIWLRNLSENLRKSAIKYREVF
jgi:uncharacterized membrane protein (TIGR01666 family)